ncbi:hypothetical protein ACEPAG_5291 [Sanghuangporus baumii]
MSKPASNWLRGSIVRKSALPSSAHSTRSSTPALGLAISSTTGSSTPLPASSSTFTGVSAGGGVKDPTNKISEFSSQEDQCPVCKSDRYLNPRLRLLVSACYHKMCESCIDRLFTLGPAPCPICNRTLRKLAFMPQTFEDLAVEKEVAVRRRLARDFNKRREDFPDLKSYNDYLEEVEDITFNLINDIDVLQTEERILKFRRENAALIEANIQRDESYASSLRQQEEAERRAREERARLLAQEEEEERRTKEMDKMELIDVLENSAEDVDANKLVAAAARRQREKERKEREKRAAVQQAEAANALSARGQRSRAAAQSAIPDAPHVPIQDDWYAYEDKYALRAGGYFDPASEAVRRDREGIMRAGGYMVEEAWERALRCAVAGLDIAPLTSSAVSTSDPIPLLTNGDVIMASV